MGDYPFEAATAVQGALSAGGGMEYPMVTVISAGSGPEQLDNVITHEVGHNWFYGILGSNEREYAWMDEGINSYIEERYMKKYYPDRTFSETLNLPKGIASSYEVNWSSYLMATIHSSYGYQIPINTPSIEMPMLQYGLLSYQRTAFLLNYLAEYLGQETFDACMHRYFDAWKFKHPQPEDIQYIFEGVSGKKLDWFFDGLFNTEQQFDYSLSRIKTEEHSFILTVKNHGTIAAPFPLYLIKGDSVLKTLWIDGHCGSVEIHVPKLGAEQIVLDQGYISPDLSLRNNRIRTRGLFRKSEPLKLKLVPGFTRNDWKALRVHPAIGYNTHDGLLLGVMLHNYDIQGKKFGYFLMPMYGLASETFTGNFLMKYDWFIRDRSLKKVRLMAQYKRFAGYEKIEPSLNFFFHTGKLQHAKHWLSLSHAWIQHNSPETRFFSSYQTSRLRYQMTKNNALLKESLGIAMLAVKEHVRVEATYQRTDRIGKKSKLKSRAYAGWAMIGGSNYFDLYSAGSPDINKDYYLIDRVGNKQAGWLGTNQALMDQGGFMSYNLRADSYMLSLNLEYQYKWYFHPYVHGLLIDDFLYYETGLGLSLGILDVYFPVSSNVFVNGIPESGKQWVESVRFTLNLNLG
ncbi:MAG: M1 family aminopeptidase, partial [Bacteroidia bacterium]